MTTLNIHRYSLHKLKLMYLIHFDCLNCKLRTSSLLKSKFFMSLYFEKKMIVLKESKICISWKQVLLFCLMLLCPQPIRQICFLLLFFLLTKFQWRNSTLFPHGRGCFIVHLITLFFAFLDALVIPSYDLMLTINWNHIVRSVFSLAIAWITKDTCVLMLRLAEFSILDMLSLMGVHFLFLPLLSSTLLLLLLYLHGLLHN